MKKMLTPSDLQTVTAPVNVAGNYSWEKQAYQYENCKFGTSNRTYNGTITGVANGQDDSTSDSYTD